MEAPYSWEHELFGSSPNESTSNRFEENTDDNSSGTSVGDIGDGGGEQQVSVASPSVPQPLFATNFQQPDIIELGPTTGMLFPDLESIFTAYQAHAKHKGFSVTKRTSRKAGVEDYKYTVFVCDRSRLLYTKKYSKKVGCGARINASRLDDGGWVVGKTFSEHNHDLCPEMSILMPAHRTITINLKRQLEANDIVGIRVCKNVRLAEVQAGGPQNLGCLPKDCRNFVDARRRLRLGVGDAEAIRKLFLRLQHKERDFFHLMDIGENGRLRNVLWIHPRSKAAYEDFHDVVSFDTTYLVNRYKMPFATVVGVNHHGQSILLGCALVTHEDAESFKWVFSNWLEAMSGVAPVCIITDQCDSIRIAIRELMPNTIHRYCLWHILCKLPLKFKGLSNYHSAANAFKEIIFESMSIGVFERQWANFLVNYGFENNDWLRTLYDERESWVSVYLNHIFWAGMVSTQRSEGMHAYFDGYINSRCTLKQFVEQYEIATADKIQKEFLADFDSKSKVMRCVTHFPWEEQFREVYTNNIFKKVQNKINRMFYCHSIEQIIDDVDNDSSILKYKVTESIYVNGRYVGDTAYMVTNRPAGQYYECNCRSFEFRGLVCCHIYKTLCRDNVQLVNPRYILRRWRKDVYRRQCGIFFAGGYSHMTDEYKKFQEVERIFQECIDSAIWCEGKMELIKQRCEALKEELSIWSPNPLSSTVGTPLESRATESVGGAPIQNPEVARPVGRPRGTRIERNRGRTGGRSRGRRGRGGVGRGSTTRGTHDIDLNNPILTTD